MAALLPILQDIAPIILPSSVQVIKTPSFPTPSLSDDIRREPVTLPVLTGVAKKLHVTTTHLPPLTSTPTQHHSSQETILQITHGVPSLLTYQHSAAIEQFLSIGDYVLIPAWTEYQVSNGSESEEVVFVSFGSGGNGEVVVLKGFGEGVLEEKIT